MKRVEGSIEVRLILWSQPGMDGSPSYYATIAIEKGVKKPSVVIRMERLTKEAGEFIKELIAKEVGEKP